MAAYAKEENVPARLFTVLKEQKDGLLKLKAKFGPIISPAQLEAAA